MSIGLSNLLGRELCCKTYFNDPLPPMIGYTAENHEGHTAWCKESRTEPTS